MAENKTFNAKVVGTVDLQTQEAVKAMQLLLNLQKDLGDGFKQTATQAATAFNKLASSVDKPEHLVVEATEALKKMRDELKLIQTMSQGAKVLNIKDDDLKSVAALDKGLRDLAKTYDTLQRQSQIEKGVLGLDAKKAQDAIKDLKRLEEASKAVKVALSRSGGNDAELLKNQQRIEANTKALVDHIDKLRLATTVENAHAEALKKNAKFDKDIAATRAKMNADQALLANRQQLAVRDLNQKGQQDAALKANLQEKRNMEWRQKANEDQAKSQNLSLMRQMQWRQKVEEQEALRKNLGQKSIQELNTKGAADMALKANLNLKALQEWRTKQDEQEALRQNLAQKKVLEVRQRLNEQQASDERKTLMDQMRWRQSAEGQEALRQNLALKRKEEDAKRLATSGQAQYQYRARTLDQSPAGLEAASYRSYLLRQRTQQLADPTFQAQDNARRQRQMEEQRLASVYRQANVKPEVNGFFRSNSNDAARIAAAEKIVVLQRELIALDQRAVDFDTKSLALRQKISQEVQRENEIRIAGNQRNNPNNKTAQVSQAERNLARVTGTGGASLLVVQSALMANYAMLNGMTGAVRSAVSNTIELEAAFRNVQAVTATTSTEMKGLEERIKDIAATSKFSSTEVAAAALTLGQAGMSAKDVGQALGSITTLASAAGTSVAQAVDLVTSVIGVFDKQATDTADIANKITAASNQSKVSVEKLALGFQYAGNTAAQAGISFEETTAAMAAMSNAGIRSGSTMGTGLRQFIIETQKPSQEFLDTIRRLGLSMADLDFKSHGLVGVARKLREAGFVASDAIKSFDVRGAAAFNALIANPDELNRQYDSLMNTKAGLKANEVQMDSLKAQATRLRTTLENLAEVGFSPLSDLLKRVADHTATAIQWMSKHEEVVRILGTAIGATLTSAMALHIASLVRGAGALLSWSNAATGAAKSTTVLSAAQAIAASWTATWTAVRTAVMEASAAYTFAAAAGTRTTLVLEGVAAAARAAGAAFLSTPIMPLILVLGAAATAYAFMGDNADKSKEAIDKAKASADAAKGVYEDKTKTLASLNAKIQELTYKQSNAKVTTEELKNMGMSLNAQFGTLGLSIDSNTNSYAQMILKMKEVRREMEQMARDKLVLAKDENRKLETKQKEEVAQDFGSLKGSGVSALNVALKRSDMMTPAQVAMLTQARTQLSNGQPLTNVDSVRSIVDNLLQEIKAKGVTGGVGNYGAIEKLDKLVNTLDKYSRSSSELRITQAQGSGLNLDGANLEAGIAYRQKNFTVGGKSVPLENVLDTLGGNLRGRTATTGDNLKDYETFFGAAQGELTQLKEVEAQLKTDRNNPKQQNKEVVEAALTEIRTRIEGIKTDVQKYAAETQTEADIANRNANRVDKQAISSTKALSKEERAAIVRRQGEREMKFQTRGIVDPLEKLNKEQSISEAAQLHEANVLASGNGRKDRTPDMISQDLIKGHKDAEAAALRHAEADKADAALTQDFDLVEGLWKHGLTEMQKARSEAIAALTEEQNHRKTKYKDGVLPPEVEAAFKESMAAVSENFDERIRQFKNAFKGFGNVIGRALLQMEEAVKKRQQEIAQIKIDTENKVYKESDTLEALQFIQNLGKKVKDKNFSATSTYDYGTARGELSKGTADNMNEVTKIGPKGVSISSSGLGSDGGAFGGGTATSKGNSAGIVTDKYVQSMMARVTSSESPATGGTLKQRIARENIRLAEIQVGGNEQILHELDAMIPQLDEAYKAASESFETLKKRIRELEQKKKDGTLTAKEEEELNEGHHSYTQQGEYVGAKRSELNAAIKERRDTRKSNSELHLSIAKNTEELPQEVSLDSLKEKLKDVSATWAQTVEEMNVTKVFGDGVAAILGNITGQLGTSFSAMLSGTKSVKSAFRDMATSIIKSMLDIAAQMAAMQAMKGILGWFGMGASGGAGAGAGAGAGVTPGPAVGGGLISASTGGYIVGAGQLQHFANGGPVRGGVQGRDSVPAMVMPGEFVMKRTAVDAVGTDYLHSLNAATNSVVSSSAPKAAAQQQEGGTVNVWVVTPDQKPNGMGPKDVVAVISDDISRGGSIKKLIKQVATNQV